MTIVVPVVSTTFAALLGLLGVLLTARVIAGRVRTGINAGDGGDAALGQAIRAHANFAEQAPLAALLLVLAEALGAWPLAIGVLGVVLLLARLLSAFGLSRSLGASQPRQLGAGATMLVVAATALLLLYRLYPARLV